MEDKFYEPGFYAKFTAEQKTWLHELRNSRGATPPATHKVASVESWVLQLEQLTSTLPPPQPVVASLQGVSQVGVQPQYTNATNLALQQFNQIHWNKEEEDEVDTGEGLEISSAFVKYIKLLLDISASSTSASTSRTELDYHADFPVVGRNAMILYKTDMTVNVTPFSDDFGMMPEVSVVHAAVAYGCPITGNSTILNHQ